MIVFKFGPDRFGQFVVKGETLEEVMNNLAASILIEKTDR